MILVPKPGSSGGYVKTADAAHINQKRYYGEGIDAGRENGYNLNQVKYHIKSGGYKNAVRNQIT